MNAATDHESLLFKATGIARDFPGVRALDDVDFDLRTGEVHAVVGENGAGKSTLMKIVGGVQSPSAGAMTLDGRHFAPRSVHDATEAGVALIHQELNLAGNLSVAANICLGREPHRFGFLDRAAVRETARRALELVRLDVAPERRVEDLSIGQRQLVEIARALAIDARIVIMDEPTSSLTLSESERLFSVIDHLRERGVGIVYVSHRLAEVERVADRVLVLRDGRVTARLARSEIARDVIVRHMIGRELTAATRTSVTSETIRLRTTHLVTARHPNDRVSLHVRAGEKVALAGLVGAGRTELLEAIFGVTPALSGTIEIDGRTRTIHDPPGAIEAGCVLIPEDRQAHGLIVEQSVRWNLGMCELARESRWGFVNRARERETSARFIADLNVRTSGDRRIVGTLSGGNQQKVVLGKWLALDPHVLLLDEPTRGVDVGSRAEIYAILDSLTDRGAAILFASSDLEEVIAVADRVIVMRDGAVNGELTGDGIEEAAIMQMATKSAPKSAGAA